MRKIRSFLLLSATAAANLFALPVLGLTIIGKQAGADKGSMPVRIEAFSARGLDLVESVKFDDAGTFRVEIPAKGARVYWIGGKPFYLYPDDVVRIEFPVRQVVQIGGKPSSGVMLKGDGRGEAMVLVGRRSPENNLLSELTEQWNAFSARHFSDSSAAMKDSISIVEGIGERLVLARTGDRGLREMGMYFNRMRSIRARLTYANQWKEGFRADEGYYTVLGKAGLDEPEIDQLDRLTLTNAVSAYTGLILIKNGVADEKGFARMNYLLSNVRDQRVIDEQAGLFITLRFRDKGLDKDLLGLLPLAKERIRDSALLAMIGQKEREYSTIYKDAEAPAFALRGADNKVHALSDYKGKVVAIDVWATWCSGCVRELPYFLSYREKYKDNDGVVFLTVSVDGAGSEQKWTAFLDERKMRGTELTTMGDTADLFRKAYSVIGIPRYILIDRNGKIVFSHGPHPSEAEYGRLLDSVINREGGPSIRRLAPAAEGPVRSRYPLDWHMRALEPDSLYGTVVNRVYAELLKGRKPKKVIVAVLDSGLDTDHEDLKSVLWTNKKEIPGNGIDDDHNGYVDDIHGWNFLATSDGATSLDYISREPDREYYRLKHLYADKDTNKLAAADREYYRLVKQDSKLYQAEQQIGAARKRAVKLLRVDSVLRAGDAEGRVRVKDFLAMQVRNEDTDMKLVYGLLEMRLRVANKDPASEDTIGFIRKVADEMVAGAERSCRQLLALVEMRGKDGNAGRSDKAAYGNGELVGRHVSHGTHVAGIIGADRNNEKGMKGIADAVEIMGVRVIPAGGDEYDKDIALAIRYAVDNGAGIINMSFGKLLSPGKRLVDEAIRYADAKGVLILHAAGNDGMNTDEHPFYPAPFYMNGGRAENVLTVGGSDVHGKLAGISNYGKQSVDVFAPSHAIYSTMPGNMYSLMDGTSVSAPVAAGIAALIRCYFPKLGPRQVREILMKSVTKVPAFSDISVSGGIINAYAAFKLAEKYH